MPSTNLPQATTFEEEASRNDGAREMADSNLASRRGGQALKSEVSHTFRFSRSRDGVG